MWKSEVLGPLGRRVAAGSLAIALVSIALVAAGILLVVDADVGTAGRDQEAATTGAIVAAVRSAYLANNKWQPSDLAAAGDLARNFGVGVEVLANGRRLLQVAALKAGGNSLPFSVVVGRRVVATVTITLPRGGLPGEADLRRSIERGVAEASGLAVLVAFGAAVLASRRLVAPVRSLTLAARQLGAGDRTSRVSELAAPGELGELARAFDKMAADLERGDALRRALVADVSHELRTPLAVMQAELEGLSVGLVALDQQAVVTLTGEVARLTRSVEDLGMLAAADAAGLSLRRERVDLAQVGARAAARLAARFDEVKVELAVTLAPAEVEGDPGRLEQVVVNLLSNAAKFTPAGGRVQVSVGRLGRECRVVVSDTGEGIPEDEQPWVFDRFFRGAAAKGRDGSGIGLAVVAALVAAHGGSIELRSVLGSGSTFTVRLPSA